MAARTLLKLGRFPTPRPLLPFILVSGAATLLLVPPLWPLVPAAFATYTLPTGAEAVRVGSKLGAPEIPTVWAIFRSSTPPTAPASPPASGSPPQPRLARRARARPAARKAQIRAL